MCEVLAQGEKQQSNVSHAHVGAHRGWLNGRQMYLRQRYKGNRVETFQNSRQRVCVHTQARLNESQSHQSQITPDKTCLALRFNSVSERDLIPEQKPHRQKLAMC